ncbi:hypothetical protein QYE76_069346 [Lolium multiflorum]|uniref:DUF6598 domain-containing protein n=1 Tax=Lolium multiflorum TaxID=4521 RepID=A0AAD8WCJ1_LOLMU|nr:hypothetical protein QYE76_069346 [Lolium multiflorum]
MEVDGESYKSWAWWLDALQAMRTTYSIPMDAKEARIRADVAEATLRLEAAEALRKGQLMRWIGRRRDPEVLRVAAEEARRMDRLHDELTAVSRWAKTKDPKAAACREQLDDKLTEMYLRTEKEERQVKSEGRSDGDKEAREACEYRSKWKSLHSYYRGGSYDDTSGKLPVTADGMIALSRHVVCVEIKGKLKIAVATEYANGEQVTTKDAMIFTPRQAGKSSAILMTRPQKHRGYGSTAARSGSNSVLSGSAACSGTIAVRSGSNTYYGSTAVLGL